jgi:hypothetical protein
MQSTTPQAVFEQYHRTSLVNQTLLELYSTKQ